MSESTHGNDSPKDPLHQEYPECLQGYFLISEVDLMDPNFHRTVVLITEHNKDGAFGLVVNRRSQLTLGDVIPEFETSVAQTIPVYIGGPLQPEFVFTLHGGLPVELRSEHAVELLPNLVFEPVFDVLGDYLRHKYTPGGLPERDGSESVHLYAGYAGWAEGQLERELSQGAWVVRPASAAHIFNPNPEAGWEAALSEMGGLFKIVAQTGYKPSLN